MTMHAVLRLIQSDFSKVILFFTLTIIASAIASPWIYNAGMLLAEVGQSRALNPLLDWLANRCADATFASFYNYTLLGCAIILAGTIYHVVQALESKLPAAIKTMAYKASNIG